MKITNDLRVTRDKSNHCAVYVWATCKNVGVTTLPEAKERILSSRSPLSKKKEKIIVKFP